MQLVRRTPRVPVALLAALGTALLAPTVRASAPQEPGARPAAPTAPAGGSEDVDARTLDRKRLLTLADGTILRARARWEASGTAEAEDSGAWLVRKDRAWVPVDAEVVSVRLEREMLREGKRLAQGLGRDEHRRRVEVARWFVAQGLHPEAIRELDRVLARDPDQRDALRAIAELPIELELDGVDRRDPAAVLRATLKAGARATPATREVCVQRLADFQERTDLRALVAAELRAGQPKRREFATFLARRLYGGEFVRELCGRAVLDPMPDVRLAAAHALRDAGDPGVLFPIADAMESRHPSVRTHAIEAMAAIAHPAAVEPLVAHLANLQAGGAPSGVRGHMSVLTQIALVVDYDVEIAQAASIGDPIVGVQSSGVVHDVRAQAQITRMVEMRTVVAALEDLTALDLGSRPESWLGWWDQNGASWREKVRATRSAETQ